MPLVSVDAWSAHPNLTHGFLTRSTTPTIRTATASDWEREIGAHGGTPIAVVVPRQVHGTRVARVTATERPEADGLITTVAGVGVGVVTADCAPVLLLAPTARVAVAVHSGWRGTLGGIVREAVGAIATAAGVAPSELGAAIGPAIGPCCYEVGPEVRSAFVEHWGEDFVAPFFTDRQPRPYLDLRALVRRQLEAAGLRADAIAVVGPCTKCAPAYASARRDGVHAGRQLSFIGWRRS
jgi:hypothetical protein